MSNEKQTTESMGSLFKAYNDFNALKIRLDTEPLMGQIELFLRGATFRVEQDPETGRISTKKQTLGVPKMNDDGIQTLLNWLHSTINPQTVQGNFYVDKGGFSDKYEEYIEEYNIELATLVIENAYNWEVPDSELRGIIDNIMLMVIPFMSRLIDNKERDSYGQTMRSVESNTTSNKGVPLLGS